MIGGNRFKGRMKMRVNPAGPAYSPRGVANNGEFAHLYSGNILYDPGAELFVGNAVGSYHYEAWSDRTGMRHYTLPVFDPTCDVTSQRWPNGDCVTYWDISQWVAVGSYAPTGRQDSSAWHVGRFFPNLGDYSIIWHDWPRGPGGNPMMLMVQAPGLPGGYSARVEPGDLVTFSANARVWGDAYTGYAQLGDPTISTLLWFYTKTGTLIVGSGDYYVPLTTTYTANIHEATAPSGTYFVRAMLAFTASTPSDFDQTLMYYPAALIDSGVLSIE